MEALALAIIGWIIIFCINRYFHGIKLKTDKLERIKEQITQIEATAFDFWVNERINSCQSDQIKLASQFKQCRSSLNELKSEDKPHAILLLHDAKKILTNTPVSIRNFADMNKSSGEYQQTFDQGANKLHQLKNYLDKL